MRQRQNLGSVRARGIEVSALTKLDKHWEISSEYLLTDSIVLRFPANRSLEGLLVPQVPRQSVQFPGELCELRVAGGKRRGAFVSQQFDDDQNALPLKRFFTLDAEVSRRVSERVRCFVAFQN